MNENGYEVDAEKVLKQLSQRIADLELENAYLKSALNQFTETKTTILKEGE